MPTASTQHATTSQGSQQSPMPREMGLDVYRGLAVLLMFIGHSWRMQALHSTSTPARAVGERALLALAAIEPFTIASFLFIVGFSLVLSRAASGDLVRWRRRMLRRALALYLASLVLFVPHYGFELPDLFVSSGILSVIALAIVLVVLGLSTTHPTRWLIGSAVLVVAVTAWLGQTGRDVAGLNAGPGGAFPLIAFSAVGGIAGRLYRRNGVVGLGIMVALCLLPLGVSLASGASWVNHHRSVYADHGGELALSSIFEPTTRTATLLFWNPSAAGALGLLLPLTASVALLLVSEGWLRQARVFAPLALLGRHALGVYVLHLGLLGVADLVGLHPMHALQTWALALGITLLALATALVLDRRPDLVRRARRLAVGAG